MLEFIFPQNFEALLYYPFVSRVAAEKSKMFTSVCIIGNRFYFLAINSYNLLFVSLLAIFVERSKGRRRYTDQVQKSVWGPLNKVPKSPK